MNEGRIPRLLVNIDHVATLRNARGEGVPDPAEAAVLCERAGAAGIVFHLRGDRRHIRDGDLPRLKEKVRGRLDFEMAATDEMIAICRSLKPDLCTLVPEGREELTTEGGLRMGAVAADLRDRALPALQEAGIPVSLFVDPVLEDVRQCAELGVEAIELHTGTYANAFAQEVGEPLAPGAQVRAELDRLSEAAHAANELGLHVHAGHGLNRMNLPLFLSEVPHLRELSIGHALVSDALRHGLETSVRLYLALLKEYRG